MLYLLFCCQSDYTWFTPKKILNSLRHAYLGNERSRISPAVLASLFTALKAEHDSGRSVYGRAARVKAQCMRAGFTVNRKLIQFWSVKFSERDWEFDISPRVKVTGYNLI